MKHFISLLLTVTVVNGFTQSATYFFEGNNFRWAQVTDGALFFDDANAMAGIEIPAGQNNHTIFVSTLWVGGINQEDELRIFFKRFCVNDEVNCENLWGPLASGGSPNEEELAQQYNRFWFVTSEEVTTHIDYFECLDNPNCDVNQTFPNGYDIPEAFMTWPAHGDTLLGFDFYLAPFFDANSDNVYNAEDGDYPIFCGDFSTYLIRNDVGTQTIPVDPEDIGIEIHTQVYGYNSPTNSLFNSLFVQHKLINRGSNSLSNTFLTNWVDFDIGNPNDDFVGTDVSRSMFYAYNGDPDDEESPSGPGYGEDLPAMGVRILGGPFSDSDGLDNAKLSSDYETYGNQTLGYEDGIADNERLGLSASVFHNNASGPTFAQDPQIGVHYYNYMKGLWRDGTPISFGQWGYNVDGNGIPAQYFFPGTTDPLNLGTNGVEPNYPIVGGWTEENEDHIGSDRRMLGSSGPFTFLPGDVQYLDLAYIFARESFDENETVIETLQRYADEIVGMECGQLPPITLSDGIQETRELGIDIFPNPAKHLVNFRFSELFQNIEIEIRDVNGRLVSHNRYGMVNQVDLDLNLAPGVYLVRVLADDQVGSSKLVISE
jgi:hypothetical protein